MKRIFAIAATVAAVGGSLPAIAQTQQNIAVAPADRSTGPTIMDPRSADQNTTLPPSHTTKSNDVTSGNWRTSDGFNNDPNNPSGAPGPSSGLGTSPTR
jgi:hypothetical protein